MLILLLVYDVFACVQAKQISAGTEKTLRTKCRKILSVHLKWDMVTTKSLQVITELFTSVAAEITGGLKKHKNVTYSTRSVCHGGIKTYEFSAH